jgi:lipoprotein-anchoring transpeptidase ErfK/SrfK
MGLLTSLAEALRGRHPEGRGILRPAILAAVMGAAAFALLLLLTAGSQHATRSSGKLPNAPLAAFRVPTPKPLQSGSDVTVWAPVLARTVARRAPDRSSPRVASVSTETPEGTSNLLVIVGRPMRSEGEEWLRVRLATLPAGQTGWVERRVLGAFETVATRLVVDRAKRTATLFKDGRVVFRAPVGVGRASSPTPPGQFYVRDRLGGFHNAFYGPLAFGTSARSATLTEWPDGGFIGLHGTNRPRLIPGAISHGCIRFTNADIERLGEMMPIGTPVTIR